MQTQPKSTSESGQFADILFVIHKQNNIQDILLKRYFLINSISGILSMELMTRYCPGNIGRDTIRRDANLYEAYIAKLLLRVTPMHYLQKSPSRGFATGSANIP